jgi:hypothetical protein
MPDPAPSAVLVDSPSHNLIYLAAQRAAEASGHVRRALAYGRWHGPWQDTIAVLREAATALQDLEKIGGPDPEPAVSTPAGAAAEPCRWCGRPTLFRVHDQPGHESCWVRAGRPARTGAIETRPDSPAVTPKPASAANDPVKPAAAPERRSGRPEPVRRFTVDPDTELADFARALRRRVPAASDTDAAAALAAWHAAVQHGGDPVAFVSTPGYTGVTLFEWLVHKERSMVIPEPLTHEQAREVSTGRRVWRALSFVNADQKPVGGQGILELDVNAQYLAAARSAELGDGNPERLGPISHTDQPAVFKRPGYIQLAAAPDLTGLPATVRCAFRTARDGWWLPTPAARYLQHDHGLALDVADSIVWPAKRLNSEGEEVSGHGRRLSVWCKVLADARAVLEAQAATDPAAKLALVVLKSTYATFLGGMTRSRAHNDKSSLREDWSDQYVAQANVNALRAVDKALKAHAQLLGALKDSYWFQLDPAELGQLVDALTDRPPGDQDPLTWHGMTISRQPGKWHPNRWATVISQDIVDTHAIGRPGILRRTIRQADDARTAAA